MKPSDFQPAAPGKLVPTTAIQRRWNDNGASETVPVPGLAFVPNPLPPKVDRAAFLGALTDDIVAAERELDRLLPLLARLPDPKVLLRCLRMIEARLSSRIEETLATIEEMVLVEAEPIGVRDEAREVTNNLLALEHGLASPLPLCTRLFCDMHASLLSGVRGQEKNPGKLRDRQVYIGDGRGFEHARFVPPPPNELDACLREYEKFLNPGANPRDRFPMVVEIAMSHYQFEAIHPFNDGNGRLGRLIVTLMPCKQGAMSHPGIYLSQFIDATRREYYDLLLRVSTHGDWAAWTRYMCEAVVRSSRGCVAKASELIGIRENMLAAARGRRVTSTSAQLVDFLFAHPAVTVRQAATKLGVSFPTAQKHIERLVQAGVLEEVSGRQRDRVFVARQLVNALERGWEIE